MSPENDRRNVLKYIRKSAGILSLLLLFNSIGLTACGQIAAETGYVSMDAADAEKDIENIPATDAPVSALTVDVLVDRQGYAAEGEKQAVIKGRQPAETFRLVNKETGETVYEGAIKQKEYNEELEQYIGIADFTDYTGEGVFYLECGNVGRSLPFSLKKDHYQELLTVLCEDVRDRCQDRSITEDEIIPLLAACEWYPQVFADDNGNEIPDVLEYIADWLEQTNSNTDTPEPGNMCYVAAMAKFSYLYQKYDEQYAAKWLQQASTIYTGLETNSDSDAEKFLALTELYRASGLLTYRNQILEYQDFFEDNTGYLEEETAYLYGTMTYLSARQPVDIKLCTLFMESIRDRGEELAKQTRNMMDVVTNVDYGTEELLKRAEELSCANYVLFSYQYTEILKDFLHYLMGCNRDLKSYYPGEENAAEYLLLIAQQVSLADKQ